MRILETKDVVALLRSEVEKVGGVGVWAKQARVNRTAVSKALSSARPPTKAIIKALKLHTVIVADNKGVT